MNLNEYQNFVESVTSEESNNFNAFAERLYLLDSTQTKTNISLLLTSALGLSAEAGEFTEIVKKIIFQGKPLSDDNIYHLKRELSDICWYLANSARALSTDLDTIIDMNVEKLKSRYPQGFDVDKSENRKQGDI